MKDLILYDGVCGLCNGVTRFVLKRDGKDRFRFSSIQGAFAREILSAYGRDPDALDTIYVVRAFGTSNAELLSRSRAVFHILRSLGGLWSGARLFELLPVALTDAMYTWFAKRRYGWFGRYDSCPVPAARDRAKFLE